MLVDELAQNIQHGKQTDLILLDFSKAFDRVSHNNLIYKLHQLGVRDRNLAWISGLHNTFTPVSRFFASDVISRIIMTSREARRFRAIYRAEFSQNT